MSISTKQELDFINSVMPTYMLGEAIDWISANLSPSDVFSADELAEWALDNGFKEDGE